MNSENRISTITAVLAVIVLAGCFGPFLIDGIGYALGAVSILAMLGAALALVVVPLQNLFRRKHPAPKQPPVHFGDN